MMVNKQITRTNRINNRFRNMRSNIYATIDAHILQCRLHHKNNLSYSVGLKSGKDQSVNTTFKTPQDLIIDMNTHLTLHVDKHSYQNFPKLTLVVNVMNQSKDRKTVGTTFASFRKDGTQTYQISQCSCKDKAFEVDIVFTTKVAQAKISNSKSNKKQSNKPTKTSHYTHQPTPRQSRELKPPSNFRSTQELQKIEQSPIKEGKLIQVKSQKNIHQARKINTASKKDKRSRQLLQKQLAVLNQKIIGYQLQILEVKKALQIERMNHEKWYELFKLQEEKNGVAMSHIVTLQEIILNCMPKGKNADKNAVNNSFRAIQEEDQIYLINEELQNSLEKERCKNQNLLEKMQALCAQISFLEAKLKEYEQKINNKRGGSGISGQRAKSPLESSIQSPNEIMLSSRCQEKKQQKRQLSLKSQIKVLEQQYSVLKQQIDNLQNVKKNLEKQKLKGSPQSKKNFPSLPTKPPVRQAHQPRLQRASNKQKNQKPAPLKNQKISNMSSQSTEEKKMKKDVQKSSASTMGINTKTQTELQTKTEGAKSFGKSSSIGINQMKSQNPTKLVECFVKTFEGGLNEFQQ